jgi:NADPH2:quinone reductase
MKAIRVAHFGAPEVLQAAEVPDPRPGPGEVVVRVKAAGVNPVDTYIRAGGHGYKPALPYTPGSDAAGLVEAVGEGVTRVKPGDRVYTARTLSGAYAELALCAQSQVHALPEAASFAQGAALGVPYGTAYRALFQRGRARTGERVLVHGGSGGVGTAALQLCRLRGLRAAATAGTARGRALALEQGAQAAFDHSAPGYEPAIREWTGGRGCDLIVELLANVNLRRDLELLAPRGRVVVVGSRGTVELDPRAAMTLDADILGMSLFNATPEELDEAYAAIGAGLAARALSPVIGAELPLAEAARAHERVMTPGAHGKIILVP